MGRIEVIRSRMQMAFPELAAWFVFLEGGYLAGATWQSLLDGHRRMIGPTRTRALAAEAADAMQFVGYRTVDLDKLLYTLGLDETVLATERCSAEDFLELLVAALAAVR